MFHYFYVKIIGIYIILSVTIHSFACESDVRMTITVNTDSVTLSCLVAKRNPKKNIFLLCPLAPQPRNCRENCKDCHKNECPNDDLVKCVDRGQNNDNGLYQIDYIIDGSRPENHGSWMCQYGGTTSSVISVNTSSSKTNVPQELVPVLKHPQDASNRPNVNLDASNENPAKRRKIPSASVTDDNGGSIQYDKLLTKTEFIITVIGLLTLSLIFNIFFCSRMIIVHCRSKKKANDGSQYFSMNPNQPPYNRSNSQASDPDRIYEDTSMNHRQLSFLTQIKNANGSYIAPSSLCPPSGFSTMLPHHLAFNPSMSIPQSPSDSGSTQMNHPLLADHPLMANYASVNCPTENSYTNFLSVQPDLCYRDVSNGVSQPVYLAFQSTHPIMTAGNRYVQYSSPPPIQTLAPSNPDLARSVNHRPEPGSISSSSRSNGPTTAGTIEGSSDDNKTNYQLSREMMEEADTLLRTADSLLKSTENEMKFYQQ